MNRTMMIKALILIHLWSLVVATGAWALQRDSGPLVGTRFPAPRIWLSLIILSLLPSILSALPVSANVSLLNLEIFDTLPTSIAIKPTAGFSAFNYLTIYIILALLLMGRTIFLWARLQFLSLTPSDEADIFITASGLPPLTLSWPRQVVVIPDGLQAQAALIQHERAHLHHRDAELTLLLLLLQDIMLRSPGISYLVRQWRLSIELRADQAATKMLTTSERKDYAALLLNGLRSNGNYAGGGALPCPTADLTSTRHRSVKMRLTNIIENKPNPRKHRWSVALLLTTLGASMIGLMSTATSSKNEVLNAKFDRVDYVKRTPLQMPATCPGLISVLKKGGIKVEEKELMVNGRLVSQQTMNLGTVALSHDVRRGGNIYNPHIVGSTHPCFEAEAKAAIVQWMTAPQEFEIKNVAVKLNFVISGATIDELKQQLGNLDQ
ncbi:MAG: hypothetical protein COA69_04890 [Robiginitomaculum sp.]|nr:MAG: hypothetical protein COA69_04890 [Robiginitomaculum sp.]